MLILLYFSLKEIIVKRLVILSALTGILAVSGCSNVESMMDTDKAPMPSAAVSHTVPVTSMNGVLVDLTNTMTLYTFDKDSVNKSNCMGDCLKAWPALVAPSTAKASGQYTAIQRDDGSYQWAVNGKPLYFYVQDMKAGDMNGDKKGGVWHVVPTQ